MLTAEQKKQIITNCYEDPSRFCKTFLRHWFPTEMPWFHRGVIAILTKKTDWLLKYGELDEIEEHFVYPVDPTDEKSPKREIFRMHRDEYGKVYKIDLIVGRYTLLMLPRGFSKTTLTNAMVLYCLLYKVYRFPVYISAAAPHAIAQLSNVKRELETNINLIEVYGNLKPDGRDTTMKWQAEYIELTNGARIACRGRGGQIRGLNVDAIRPDFLIPDDIEDKESVKSDTMRATTLDWAYADMMPALPHHEGTIVALATMLHPECLAQKWRSDPEWTSVVLGALDNHGNPLWPWAMDAKKIERKKLSYARIGRLHLFYMEYMNTVRNEEAAKFKSRYFTYQRPGPEELDGMQVAIALDPAISEDVDSDYAAVAVGGMSTRGIIYVLDVWCKVDATPREQIDKYFEFFHLYGPQFCGVESNAFQAALIHIMREEMFRKHTYFEIEKITHSTKKDERILGVLQPRYAAGYIYHARRFPELESQLLDFPSGKKDAPDAVAMMIALLDPTAAQAADPEEDLTADQYEPHEEYGVDF